MRIARALSEVANGTSSVYRIVFTAMLLFELVRFGLKKRRENAEAFRDASHNGRR